MSGVAQAQPLSIDQVNSRVSAINLFLVGFLVLFHGTRVHPLVRVFYVVFLQFFTNVVLIASFLGMSCGCMAAPLYGTGWDISRSIALATVVAALGMFAVYYSWRGLSIDVGGQTSPQEVFFGTEDPNPDVAQFVVPIEAIAAISFRCGCADVCRCRSGVGSGI